MTFNIRFLPEVLPGSVTGDAAMVGEILLGEDIEGFESLIGFWSPLDYRVQWLRAVQRLVRERKDTCLVTSVDDPSSGEVVAWWLLYLEVEIVHVREALLLPNSSGVRFSTSDPYALIPVREGSGDDDEAVSEWQVPLSDFADFLDASSAK